MITTSDFIKCAIIKGGYKSVNDFCKRNGLKERNFENCFDKNVWTKKTLQVMSEILGVDLSRFENAKIGLKREVYYANDKE